MSEVIFEIKEIETKRPCKVIPGAMDEYEGYEIWTSEQKIVLIIDSEQNCCEKWGYFFCNEDVGEFIGAELHKILITDTALNTEVLLDNSVKPDSFGFGGDIIFVSLETSKGTLQFVAYNAHNGYYGHRVRIESKTLNHNVIL